MLTFFNVVQSYGIDATTIRLARHGNKEIPVLETFRNDPARFEVYQSYQAPEKFGSARHVASFAPHRGTKALFLGLWDVEGCTPNAALTGANLSELRHFSLPEEWMQRNVRYELKRNPLVDDLSERLVIDWGGATVAWVQSRDKTVVELKPKDSIGTFTSFDEVILPYDQLRRLYQNPEANETWVSSLSSINGVYLVQDQKSGKQYVGSAYGQSGVFGRWSEYAVSGHGGNLELKGIDPSNFVFSLLEIIPATTTHEGVIERESRWKAKLGTRRFGLNRN